MKTCLRMMAMGAVLVSLVLCVGCDQLSATAQEVPTKPDAAPAPATADEPKPAEAKPAELKPAETTATPVTPPAAIPPGTVDTNLARNPVPPSQLKLTPALTDVIKLVQAGVGEEVLMSYITNSVGIFNIGPDEILYLHDLGVPGPVITSLIQQDSTPDSQARKQAANAVQPLPPGVALNKPATNIFLPRAPGAPAAPAPETAEVSTEAPPVEAVDTNAPAVVYTVPTEVQQPVSVAYFYTELAPYGTWVDLPGYGNCWRPTVSVWNSSWRPYCDGGRWLWSDCGWYWYSDYTWGASVFHYGRWACPPGRGWVWVPDVHWGPAWVSWRQTRSHCAWAPLPPSAKYISGHGWYHNTLRVGADCEFGLKNDAYVALPRNQMLARRPSSHYLSPRHTQAVVNDSSVANHYATINNRVVNQGVGIDAVTKGGNVRPVAVRPADNMGPRSPRRELLSPDGQTVAVARPPAATPIMKPPARPISSLSNQRTRSGDQSSVPQNPSPADIANRAAQNPPPAVAGGPTVVPSTRAPIIMRGSSRAATPSSAASTVTPPVTKPTPPATVADSGNPPALDNNNARRTPLPGGRRPTTDSSTAPRPTASAAVNRPPTVAPTAPASVAPARTQAARPETPRAVAPQAVYRVQGSPAPVQSRGSAPAASSSGPAFRAAPSAPAAATVVPRESYRAPSVAPAPRSSAPVQSSGGGGSRPSSRDYSGGSRGSR